MLSAAELSAAAASRHLLGQCSAALSLLGLWEAPGAPPETAAGSLRRRLAAAFALGTFGVTMATATLGLLLQPPADLEQLSMAVFVSTGSTAAGCKAVFFIVHRRRTQRLVLRLLEARRLFTDDPNCLRTQYHNKAQRIGLGYQVSVMVPAFLWVFTPAVVDAMSSPPSATNSMLVATRGTPLPLWVPFDFQHSPIYELVYAAQAVINVVINLTGLLLDVFFVVLMINVTGELDVLNNCISTLQPYDALSDGGEKRINDVVPFPKTVPDIEQYSSRDMMPLVHNMGAIKSHMYLLLVKNIQHHQIIMMCVEDLEKIMSQSIYVILLTNVINVCSQAFASAVLFQRGIDWGLVIKMLFTFMAYMFETGMFCMFGQAITDQSERLVVSAGGCGWPEADAATRKTLLVFLVQASRPLTLKVGKIVVLSRNTFLQLVNMSYTVFNLLYELQSTA